MGIRAVCWDLKRASSSVDASRTFGKRSPRFPNHQSRIVFQGHPKKAALEKEFDADLAVLDAGPASDVRNLAKIAYTIRPGRIIYQRP